MWTFLLQSISNCAHGRTFKVLYLPLLLVFSSSGLATSSVLSTEKERGRAGFSIVFYESHFSGFRVSMMTVLFKVPEVSRHVSLALLLGKLFQTTLCTLNWISCPVTYFAFVLCRCLFAHCISKVCEIVSGQFLYAFDSFWQIFGFHTQQQKEQLYELFHFNSVELNLDVTIAIHSYVTCHFIRAWQEK